MNLSAVFIRRPVMATLMAMAIAAFGIKAYQSLPVSDLPNVYYPVIVISAAYPGASALTMASAVAAPLEQNCQGLAGLTTIHSKSRPGYCTVELTFDLSRDLDAAAQDVQGAINRAASDLPDDLPAAPTYAKINPADSPILYLAVSSETLTLAQLYTFGADKVARRLSQIDGVAQVEMWGSRPAVRLQVDPDKLAARNLSITDLALGVVNSNVTIPAGSTEGPFRSFFLQNQSQFASAAEFNRLIVAYRHDSPIYLEDIGQAVDSVEATTMTVRLWQQGQKAKAGVIALGVHREPGRNTVALAKAIRQALPEIRRDLPGSVELETIFDRSVPIVASVDDVKQTLLIAFILVVAVIFLFMGRLTDTIIPAIALPASLLATFVVMYLLGYDLDLLSLMALTMSVGFVVDDAIVVLENTARHVEGGQKPYQAALDGSREITGTVWSMTMSLAVVFVPLVFMPGVIGRVFREFAVTIVAAIFCSGVVSITLTPSMCGRFLRARSKEDLGLLERASGAIVGFCQKIYLFFLRGLLRFSPIAILIWIVCLYGTFWMFKHVPLTFLPPGDSGAILGEMNGQHGTSPQLMQKYQEEVEAALAQDPHVEMVFTVSGMSQLGANKGFVFITLTPRAARPPMERVVPNLDRRLGAVVGVEASLSPLPVLNLGVDGGGEGGGEYNFVLRGSDPEALYKVADEFTQKLGQVSGFRDVASGLDIDAPQLDIKIKGERAASLGVEAKEIERTLLLAFAGYQISTIKAATEEYQVIVEVSSSDRRGPEDLGKLYVRSTGGDLVPLSEVAEWVESVGPMEVKHLDQQNEVSIEFNLDEGVHLGEATKTVESLAAQMLPPTINAGFKGEAEEFKKMTKSLFFLMIIATLVMYLVLGVLYESYLHPITVLSALPVAGFGGLATLYLFHSELSLYAFVGLFLLMGIVKKNGIMMVDFANQRLAEGVESRREAIYQACQARFRPIVMTGLAAIMGAMPIALGWGVDGTSRQPLGLTVVGGMIFSQLITMFITPVIYLYLEWFQEKVLFRLAFFRPPEGRRARLGQN